MVDTMTMSVRSISRIERWIVIGSPLGAVMVVRVGPTISTSKGDEAGTLSEKSATTGKAVSTSYRPVMGEDRLPGTAARLT